MWKLPKGMDGCWRGKWYSIWFSGNSWYNAYEILIFSMEFLKFILPLIAWYVTILLGDFIWLGYVMKQFTIREFGSLVVVENGSIRLNLLAGLIAWGVIVLLIYVFVIRSVYAHSYVSALGYGALMGFLSYAMYDLTNLTFLKNYSLPFTIVDIAWGTFLCALVALVMYSVQRYF